MTDKKQVSKDTILTVLATEAGGFYNLVITIASSFLGGSLLFIEKIALIPSNSSLYLLGLGWLALIGSIVAISFVRRLNLDSGWKALEEKFDEAKVIDAKTRKLSTGAIVLFSIGLFLIMLFGIINLVQKKEETMTEKNKSKTTSEEIIVERSIAFGSAGSQNTTKQNSNTSNSGKSEKDQEGQKDKSTNK